MSNTIVTEAMVRGVGECLQRNGRVHFPDQATLKEACAWVAHNTPLPQMPQEKLADHHVVAIANNLGAIDRQIRQSMAAHGKTASVALRQPCIVEKTDAYGDLVARAIKIAQYKLAEGDTTQVMGDNPIPNSPANAPSVVGQAENAARPDGYATGPQGMVANIHTTPQQARIGLEVIAPGQDAGIVAGAAGNSATAVSKSASTLEQLMAKLSNTEQVMGGNPIPNSPANAPSVVGQAENAARPDGYATGPQGVVANIHTTPQQARVGLEMPAPGQDAGIVAGAGGNSATAVSKSAYALMAEVLPFLPDGLTPHEKAAAVEQYANMTPEHRTLFRAMRSRR